MFVGIAHLENGIEALIPKCCGFLKDKRDPRRAATPVPIDGYGENHSRIKWYNKEVMVRGWRILWYEWFSEQEPQTATA